MLFTALVQDIGQIHARAQITAGRAVDRILTLRNWLIGAYIVEYEQNGADRAAYGARLMASLADALHSAGHAGLGVRNLKNFRQVALTWPHLDVRALTAAFFGVSPSEAIRQTMSAEFDLAIDPASLLPNGRVPELPSLRARPARALEWQDDAWLQRLFSTLSFSHLLELSRIDDSTQRAFYELYCLKERWDVRELQRQRNSLLYERVGLTEDREAVLAFARQGRGLQTPTAILRDPYVLEFLGLRSPPEHHEAELEQALIDHLQAFLQELGRDFCFVERQVRITAGNKHHFLDLLFFHRGLRCLVAIDLKIGDFEPAHAGQMNFYLGWIAENLVKPEEGPPIGILLCSGKDAEVVRFATVGRDDSVFVSRYLLELPSTQQLSAWLREERTLLEQRAREEE